MNIESSRDQGLEPTKKGLSPRERLDRNHKNYKQLADQLHLGSKEVIIIILGLMKVL